MDALNRSAWSGQRGFYEVWYLTLHDPGSRWAFWFRITINVPPEPGAPAHAFLWAFTFPPDGEGPALALLDRFPLSAFSADGGGVGCGPARFELAEGGGRWRGEVGAGDQRVAWDLELGPPEGEAFRHVSPTLYAAKVASSAVATPAMRLAVNGSVTAGERTIEVAGAVGEQGHVYGRRHAHRWTWAHCAQFDDAPGACFDGVSAQVSKGGLVLPPASPLCFQTGEGEVFRWNKVRQIWRIDSEFVLGRWTFEARQRGMMLRGSVTAPPQGFVSVEYQDPDGSPLYCSHSEAGVTRIDLFRRRGLGWSLDRSFTSSRTAFEHGERERDLRCQRRLDHDWARSV
jgi:hypothetical protein